MTGGRGSLVASTLEEGNECEYPYPHTAPQEKPQKDAPSGVDALRGCLVGEVREPALEDRLALFGFHCRLNTRKSRGRHSTGHMVLQVFALVYTILVNMVNT